MGDAVAVVLSQLLRDRHAELNARAVGKLVARDQAQVPSDVFVAARLIDHEGAAAHFDVGGTSDERTDDAGALCSRCSRGFFNDLILGRFLLRFGVAGEQHQTALLLTRWMLTGLCRADARSGLS